MLVLWGQSFIILIFGPCAAPPPALPGSGTGIGTGTQPRSQVLQLGSAAPFVSFALLP